MKSKSDKLSKARHELSEMYEGTRHHGRKGQSYWGNWLGENDWWFEIVSDALKEDEALQAYQPWIPVSNVKPEKSGRYIAYVPEHWTDEGHKEGKVIIAYFRELNYEGRRRVWDDGAYGISGEVTHYLPLPPVPKGE